MGDVTPQTTWICPTCNGVISTPYCSKCGERLLRPWDLTLRALVVHLFQAATSIDGRLLNSFRHLVTRPGSLTVTFVRGQRRPYIGAFQLFLIANVLFFAMQSLTDANVVGATLASHLHQQDWSAFATTMVSRRLESKQTSLDLYAPIFDHAVVQNAKTLIILMVLPFALLLPIMFHRSRQPFAAHVVFSLHFYTFVLLLFCVSLVVAAADLLVGGGGLSSPRVDAVLSVFNTLACAVYLYVATGVVFDARGAVRVAKVLVLALAANGIVVGYRFVLFLITLQTT
jgi:hypothetical protein